MKTSVTLFALLALVVSCGDDITPGDATIRVTPTSGLTTTEGGGSATFTVVLASRPMYDVAIPLSSSNSDEGTVSPATLTFTPDNYNAPQIVTVTGVQDEVADGAQTYTIVTDVASSKDSRWSGVNADDVTVSNTDDDTAGVTVTPTTGLSTSESGATAQFTAVLDTKPRANVTIALTSSDVGEGTVSPASLTFTPDNWNAPQSVTITGVDDALADGAQTYTIQTAPATSTEAAYNGLDAADVTVSNVDNDTAGVTVAPTTGLTTTEASGQASFTVVLNSQPTASVTIAIASSDTGEGQTDVASLTFTTANWNAPQTVTVTGVDDAVADGNQVYTITTAAATSADTGYNGLNADDVSVTNTDNDSAGISLAHTTGLTTTENGGQDSFAIVLNSQPTANVTIALSSSDSGEGTVSPASVTFTPANWNAPQSVTITGIDDAVADGNQVYTIITAAAVSADASYSGANTADPSVTNIDNDSPGFIVTPASGLVTTEAGGQASFTVALTSQPTADVTIPLSSSDTAEGTVSPGSLTFTAANWNAPQQVIVTGIDDAVADGGQVYTIVTGAATSGDATYASLDPADVSVTNTDNDSAGITVSPTSGLQTTEAGGQATFTIVLNSQPTASVTIGLSSSDSNEGVVTPTTVTFTIANWNAPQTVTVSGVNDAVADGNQLYTIVTAPAASADATYQGRNAAEVTVTNIDNDSAGFIVTPTGGLTTTENGGQATFTVVLTSQPTASVTVPLSSSDPTEGTVSPSDLTFTVANWNAPQTVTVTGVDDAVADGSRIYTIITDVATSADPSYGGANPSDVTITNTDNDTAGITVTPTSGLQTTEALGQATFTVVLNSQPTANVTIALSTSDATEGSVSPTGLTFTSANWNAPQLVTITGVNDFVADGNQVYTIVTAAAVSGDASYQGRNVADVSVTNLDNDSAGIIVSPISGLTTGENGDSATFTIVLASQPTASVTIGLSSSEPAEGSADPVSVTFTAANWNAPQTITVSGVDDHVADGNQIYRIVTAAATSSDTGYAGLDPDDVTLTNLDNDAAGILVNPTSGLVTSENGVTTATFAVVLQSQPTANVTIAVASNDPTEGGVGPTTLTFTALNWNAPQVVTVTGVDDNVADGNQVYLITTGAASSSDLSYNGMDAPDVSVTNVDNDSPGIRVTPTSGLSTTEGGGGASFEIVLESQPTADVTIALSSSDTTEGAITQTSLTFTPANWNAPQTVAVTGVDDTIVDGNQPYSIVIAPATSTDTGYAGIDPPNVALTNIDNDSAGVIVTPTSGLTTSEAAGGSAFFTVVLTSQPSANVTIALTSSNTNEGVLPSSTVTFTSVDWSLPQTVTINGVDDNVADGNQLYTIVTSNASSADTAYSGLSVPDVSVTNLDNDIAGVTVDPTGGLLTSEFGDFDTFTIVLNTQPTANVTISIASSDTTEATVNVASVTFTSANWNAPQTVTVTGVDDLLADGNQPFVIVTGAAVSADSAYSGLTIPDIGGSNFDNDVPGVYVKARRLLRTSENGQNTFFRVSLTTQPGANVTCTFSSSDTTEGTVSPTTVTFTPANFAMLQTVNVLGLDDTIIDGDQLYTIITAPCTSSDSSYNTINPRDVSVVNRDND